MGNGNKTIHSLREMSMLEKKKTVFKQKNFLITVCLLLFSISSLAFDAPSYFESKCSSCHTVGQGDDVGPDLKGVTQKREQEWIIRFVQESQSLVQEGDPIAVELFNKFRKKKMPDHDLSAQEVIALFQYIDSGAQGAAKKEFKSVVEATVLDQKLGQEYFLGTKKFSNGAPACLSCHSAGNVGALSGGILGPNLTNAYSSFGDKGLSKVLTNVSFPTMQPIYSKHQLNEEEVFQVKSFLYKVDREENINDGSTKKFLFLGLIGFLLVLGLFDLMWRSRRKGSRRPSKK